MTTNIKNGMLVSLSLAGIAVLNSVVPNRLQPNVRYIMCIIQMGRGGSVLGRYKTKLVGFVGEEVASTVGGYWALVPRRTSTAVKGGGGGGACGACYGNSYVFMLYFAQGYSRSFLGVWSHFLRIVVLYFICLDRPYRMGIFVCDSFWEVCVSASAFEMVRETH